ncbi:MAG: alpha/beta hydrolase [Candidatus Acidiferrales bacterium]
MKHLPLRGNGAQEQDIPANIWLYNVSSPDQPVRVGAVSVSGDANQDGLSLRIVMKDDYLYSSTFLEGLQVIDLGQAITEYQQAPVGQFGTAVSTAGEDFATDTIINTIPLPLAGGGTATMFGLQADDFATSNSGSAAATQTLLAATGNAVPFVMADPALSGLSAVLYPPASSGALSQPPLQMTSADGKTTYQFVMGRAVALGTLTVTDTSGASTSKHIAVLVGTGRTGSAASLVPALAVVDVSGTYTPGATVTCSPTTPTPSPNCPQMIGFLQLPTTASDVTLNGNIALVATGANILLVNLATPSQPVLAGQITGSFGNWLGLTDAGILVGSSPNSASGSLATSVFKPVVVIPSQTVLAKLISGDPTGATSTPVFQFVQPVTLPAELFPVNASVRQGTITVATGSSTLQMPLAFNGTSAATATLPAGTQVTGTSFQATATATSPAGQVSGLKSNNPVGPIHLVLDSDNNTRIEPDADDQARQQGKKFGFWEADPTTKATQEGLSDYAQIRLFVDALPSAGGQVKLVLSGSSQSSPATTWVLTKDMSNPDTGPGSIIERDQKYYLSDQVTATAQLAENSTSIQCSPTADPTFMSVQCQSDGTGAIPLRGLQIGQTYNLLFSCLSCAIDATETRELKVVLSQPGQPDQTIDDVPVDIRPIGSWVAVFSAREQDPPPPTPVQVPYWNNGWPNGIPQNANVTVIVHGYDVSENDALTQASTAGQSPFVPALTKRMYWTGFPMLPVQMVGNNPAYTIGFVWKGDYAYTIANLLGLGGSVAPLFFPDDTFRALESGTPLANLFTQLSSNGNKVQVIAHSLGNMVVNSALTQVSAGTVSNYIMNAAAIPAEAFFTDSGQLQAADSSAINATNPFMYGFLQPVRQTYLAAHLAQLGQTNNSVWTQELAQVLATPITSTEGGGNESPLLQYENFYGDQNPTPTDPAAMDYTNRWQFQQGQNYGPWLGYFAGNLSKANIVNSYNNADCVLDNVWYIKQLVQSPDRSFINLTIPALFGDSIDDLNYAFANPTNPFPAANLTDTLTSQQWLFQPPSSPALYGNQANYWRWSRLSYWYPATSTAVGASDFGAGAFNANTIPMTAYVGSSSGLTNQAGSPTNSSTCFQAATYTQIKFGLVGFLASPLKTAVSAHLETHGYLRATPLPSIWQGYKDIRSKLYPSVPDPDNVQ